VHEADGERKVLIGSGDDSGRAPLLERLLEHCSQLGALVQHLAGTFLALREDLGEVDLFGEREPELRHDPTAYLRDRKR
jgi:hypothetical protein